MNPRQSLHLQAPQVGVKQAPAVITHPNSLIWAAHQSACDCRFCGCELNFPEFREREILECPHCGMETLLAGPRSAHGNPGEKYTIALRNICWEAGQFGFRYLTGEVVNESVAGLAWAKIEFKLYDALGGQIGSARDHIKDFQPGCQWSFKAPVFKPEVVRALLSDITCEYGSLLQTAHALTFAGLAWPEAGVDPRKTLRTFA